MPPPQQFGLVETRPLLAAVLRPRFNIPWLHPSAGGCAVGPLPQRRRAPILQGGWSALVASSFHDVGRRTTSMPQP
jgi:hypothetical protein